MISAERRTRRAASPRPMRPSPLPRSPRRRELHSVDCNRNRLPCIICLFSAHDTHVYASIFILCSGRYIFLRIGSNTNGLLNPVLDVAVLVISDKVPVGPSFLAVSYSRAIFWRKLTACTEVSISIIRSHSEENHTGLENHLVPPTSNQLKWPPVEVEHMTTYGFCLISS